MTAYPIINTAEDLIKIGPDKAFKMLVENGLKPHTSFLYAMIAAISNRSWIEVVNDFKDAGMLKGQQRKTIK